MKMLVIVSVALLCVGAAFAAEDVDRAPGAGSAFVGRGGGNDAWGDLISSFSMPENSHGYLSGVASSHDGYIWSSNWSQSYCHDWYVYTLDGTFVRSVPITTTSGGIRDGEGHNHLGSGYFVTAQYSGGCLMYPYSDGGNPGGTGSSFSLPAAGRGIGWDGTYYYATTGTYSTPIGIYDTTGSQVGTVPGSIHLAGLYGHAAAAGYLYAATQTPGNYMREVDLTTGSYTRSFSITALGGVERGWGSHASYLHYVTQTSPSVCYTYDAEIDTGVAPMSLGKIKTLYR